MSRLPQETYFQIHITVTKYICLKLYCSSSYMRDVGLSTKISLMNAELYCTLRSKTLYTILTTFNPKIHE